MPDEPKVEGIVAGRISELREGIEDLESSSAWAKADKLKLVLSGKPMSKRVLVLKRLAELAPSNREEVITALSELDETLLSELFDKNTARLSIILANADMIRAFKK